MRFYVEDNKKKIYLNTPTQSQEEFRKKYGKNFKINGKIYSTKDIKSKEISTVEESTIVGSTIGGIIGGSLGSIVIGGAVVMVARAFKGMNLRK